MGSSRRVILFEEEPWGAVDGFPLLSAAMLSEIRACPATTVTAVVSHPGGETPSSLLAALRSALASLPRGGRPTARVLIFSPGDTTSTDNVCSTLGELAGQLRENVAPESALLLFEDVSAMALLLGQDVGGFTVRNWMLTELRDYASILVRNRAGILPAEDAREWRWLADEVLNFTRLKTGPSRDADGLLTRVKLAGSWKRDSVPVPIKVGEPSSIFNRDTDAAGT